MHYAEISSKDNRDELNFFFLKHWDGVVKGYETVPSDVELFSVSVSFFFF